MLGLQPAAGDGSPMASAAIIDCRLAVQAGEQAQNTHMPIGLVSICQGAVAPCSHWRCPTKQDSAACPADCSSQDSAEDVDFVPGIDWSHVAQKIKSFSVGSNTTDSAPQRSLILSEVGEHPICIVHHFVSGGYLSSTVDHAAQAVPMWRMCKTICPAPLLHLAHSKLAGHAVQIGHGTLLCVLYKVDFLRPRCVWLKQDEPQLPGLPTYMHPEGRQAPNDTSPQMLAHP